MKCFFFYLTFIFVSLISYISNGQLQVFTSLSGGTVNNQVWIDDLIVYKGDLYIIGEFDSIGGIAAEDIARYDGNQWHSLPPKFGYPVGSPRSFIIYKDELYIEGLTSDSAAPPMDFEFITRWDGANWKVLEDSGVYIDPLNAKGIECMAIYNDLLYIGGRFSGTSATPDYRGIGTWDGANWVLEFDTSISTNSGVPYGFSVNHEGLWMAGFFGLRMWNGDTIIDANHPNGGLYSVIAGKNFVWSDGKIDTSGSWVTYPMINKWGDYQFIDDKVLFSRYGMIFLMDTNNFQLSIVDSLPNIYSSYAGYEPIALCFYNGQLIIGNDEDSDPNGARLYSIDSAQVVSGLSNTKKHPHSVYPNPAYQKIIIHSDNKLNQVLIRDLAGNILFVQQMNSNESAMDITSISNGIYLLTSITEDGNSQTQKVIIQR